MESKRWADDSDSEEEKPSQNISQDLSQDFENFKSKHTNLKFPVSMISN